MIKSLPQVTEGAIIRCLTGIGLYEGEIPVGNFKNMDSSGNDVRRLFNQLGIIEKTTKKSEIISFSKIGFQLFENLDHSEVFGDLFHAILISKIPQYRVLTDFLVDNQHVEYKTKKSIFKDLKEKQSTSGWNLPEPTFNSLMVLAGISRLIKTDENNFLKINRINDSLFYIKVFNKCIQEKYLEIKIKQFSTAEILECFTQQLNNEKIKITLDIALEFLKTYKEELNFRFIFGVGQEIGHFTLPGTHAIIEGIGDYFE